MREVSHLQAAGLGSELRGAIDDADLASWYRLASVHGPTEVFQAAVDDDLLPLIAAAPYDMVAQSPALLALRATASAWQFDGDSDEIGAQLLEATSRLVEEGHLQWAVWTARFWVVWMFHLGDADEALDHALRLLRLHPVLADESASLVASIAMIASFAGRQGVAEPLWRQAFDHPAQLRDADEYWRVRIDWARGNLLRQTGDLPSAITQLRRARNHFAGRPGIEDFVLFHAASMNLALALILAGDCAGAIRAAQRDIALCPPDSEFAAYLHGFQAWACAEVGRVGEAERSLAVVAQAGSAASGLELMVVGPTQLALARTAGSLDRLLEHGSRLAAFEARTAALPEHRAQWRLAAGSSCVALGASAPARAFLHEAASIAADAGLVLHEATALLLLAAASPGDRHADAVAATGLERCAQHDVRRPIDPPGLHRWMPPVLVAATRDAALRPHARHMLMSADRQQVLRAAAAVRGQLPADVRDQLDEWLEELGIAPSAATSDTSATDGVVLRVLGTPLSVLRGGSDVSDEVLAGRRKARLLLVRLLLPPGQPHRREALAQCLWPKIEHERIRANLLPVVTGVRRMLDAACGPGAGTRMLRCVGTTYFLELGDEATCDAHEFMAAARECLGEPDAAAARAAGARALHRYPGDLLGGDGDDDWLVGLRHDLAALWSDVVVHMAELDPASVGIAELRRVLEFDCWREDACRALMRAYAREGNVAKASEAYHQLRQTLADDLGLLPAPATVRLHSQIVAAQ